MRTKETREGKEEIGNDITKERKFICIKSAYVPEKRMVKSTNWKGYVESTLKVDRGLDKHKGTN